MRVTAKPTPLYKKVEVKDKLTTNDLVAVIFSTEFPRNITSGEY
jgi:hypothetical protein